MASLPVDEAVVFETRTISGAPGAWPAVSPALTYRGVGECLRGDIASQPCRFGFTRGFRNRGGADHFESVKTSGPDM